MRLLIAFVFLFSLSCANRFMESQDVERSLRGIDDGRRFVGLGPAGVLKGKIDANMLSAAKDSYFENENGFGVELVWESRLLSIVLESTDRGGVSSMDVMQSMPQVLVQDDEVLSERINSGWKIKRWDVIDRK